MITLASNSSCDKCLIKGSAVALGNFDGLHIGHMELIKRVVRYAKENSLVSVVYTFHSHPNTLKKNSTFKLIMSNEQKADLLEAAGVDILYLERFDNAFMHKTPEQFVSGVLKQKLNASYIEAGFNYRFGYKGMGNADLLCELCGQQGIACDIVPPISIGDEPVSSTGIRELICTGEVDKAAKALGRAFELSGEVISGKRLGRTMGFPTANMLPSKQLIIPENGVYITTTMVDDKTYNCITNIGTAPTIGPGQKMVETHLLDYEGDLYGKHLTVSFHKRLRGETRFNGIDELKQQIHRDSLEARGYF